MSSARKAIHLALVCAAVCVAQQKGSISGVVTNAAGEPLKNATLTLRRQPPPSSPFAPASAPPPFSLASSAQGKFTFGDLDPAHYVVCAEKPGYLLSCSDESSQPGGVELTSGQTISGVTIKMAPQALIAGKVTDEYGDPYPNARVAAVRWGYDQGHRRLQAAADSPPTDAEGGFTIGDLQAGSYYLQVSARPISVYPAAIQNGREETFVTTYYPGATNPSGAVAIGVAAGEAVRGVAIRMQKARAWRIRGKVFDAAGATPANPEVTLTLQGGPDPAQKPTTLENGAFDFEELLPGVYVLDANSRMPPFTMARQTVTLGNADVEDVALHLAPALEIEGTLSIDGAAGPVPQVKVQLNPVVGRFGAASGPAAGDGSFAIHNIMPNTYRVSPYPMPSGSYVKSVRFGNQDVTKTLLDLTSGGAGKLEVVLSMHAGGAGGIVRGADGMPVPGAVVTLWTPGPVGEAGDFAKATVGAPASGQFKFDNLPPGDYFIAAWEKIETGLALAPEFRSRFESQAAKVTIQEDAHETVEAPLIGRAAIEAEAAKMP